MIEAIEQERWQLMGGRADSFLYPQSYILLAATLKLSRRLQTLGSKLQSLKSLPQSEAMESHGTSPNVRHIPPVGGVRHREEAS
jgi:hypothetical protein